MSGTHIDSMPWRTGSGSGWRWLRWKDVLGGSSGAAREFVVRVAEVQPGGSVPLHGHRQAEIDYVISGRARISTDGSVAEVGASTCLYHPVEGRHDLEVVGTEPLRYLQTFACERIAAPVQRGENGRAAGGAGVAEIGPVTGTEDRVAWRAVEASKGMKIRVKRLLDHGVEVMAGICEFDPGTHYTCHYHDQPEVYFVLSGSGVVFTGDGEVDVRPGSALYLAKREIHGLDSLGTEPLKLFWAYGCETAGHTINWTPVEPVYEHARRRGLP